MDIHDIRAGQRWESEIRTAIGEASYFIIFLSKSTVTRRGYFQKEIRLALDVLNESALETCGDLVCEGEDPIGINPTVLYELGL